MVSAEVTPSGELSFEGQIVGRLQGFRFTPETNVDAERPRVADADIASATAQEFEVRANRFSEAVDAALVLANDGAIRWLGDPVAKIAAGEKLLAPRALILADETLTEAAQQKVQVRVDLWLAAYVQRLLGPLFELEAAVGLEGPARNVAVQLAEAFGVLERGRVAHDVKALDQNARGTLRKLGVRFGAYYIYIPSLVKPAIRVLATQLWALGQSGAGVGAGLDEIPQLAASGRTSFLADGAIPKETYRVAGFRLCGDRAVRVDIVERLADLIRPAVAYRPGPNAGSPPAGAADGDGFVVTGAMTSLTGCSGEQFASVLRSLGFASYRVKGPALTVVTPSAPEVIAADAPAEGEARPAGDGVSLLSEIVADAQAAPSAATSEGAQAAAQDEAPPRLEINDEAAVAPPVAERQSAQAPVEDEAGPGDDSVAPHSGVIAEAEATPTIPEGQSTSEAPGGRGVPQVDSPAPNEGRAEQIGSASQDPEATVSTGTISNGETPGEPAAAIEEVLIEVWRPRPPPHRQRHSRPVSRDNSSARTDAAGEGDIPRPDRRDGAAERMRHRRHRPASQAPAPPTAAETGTQADPAPQKLNEEANKFRHGRGPRRSFDSANRPDGGAGRGGGANRGRVKDERKHDERRPEKTPAPATRREPPVDLNSPFAKLLALKSQLEAKGKS
jgi:ATP-dependent RNA helicase SUPV3L1/SUV3